MNSQRWNYLVVILTGSPAFFFFLRLNAGYGPLIHGVSRSHTTTHPQSEGLLWTCDQLVAMAST